MQIIKYFKQCDSAKRLRSVIHSHLFRMAIAGILWAAPALVLGQTAQVAESHEGKIVGTVTDSNHDVVSDATVLLEGPTGWERQSVLSDDNGYFEFHDVKPEVSYQVKHQSRRIRRLAFLY